MNARERKQAEAYLRAENAKYGDKLSRVPREQWPQAAVRGQIDVLRSKQFLVQIFEESGTTIRMSVNRTRLDYTGRFDDGISWDELQRLKCEAGFSEHWGMEIFPPANEVVNVANMRHLWLRRDPPEFAWRRKA